MQLRIRLKNMTFKHDVIIACLNYSKYRLQQELF